MRLETRSHSHIEETEIIISEGCGSFKLPGNRFCSMEKSKELIAAHVDSNDMAIITCPDCGLIKKTSVSKFKNLKHKISTRCQCGRRFDLQLNFRSSYRKNVNLPGTFMVISPKSSHWCEMLVRDISRTGVGFKNMDSVIVKTGDTVRVKFNLDNSKKTLIEKMVVVKTIKDQYIGCEFKDLALEEKELGFYLFS